MKVALVLGALLVAGGRRSWSAQPPTGMGQKVLWALMAAAAVLMVAFSIAGFPPTDKGAVGTIGAAKSPAAAGQVLAFRMILGQPLITAVLNGGRTADFALTAKGVPCAVRRDLAAQLWPDEAASVHTTTLTLGEVVLRNVACRVDEGNTIAFSSLGWTATFDYAARELLLRRTSEADEIGHPVPLK